MSDDDRQRWDERYAGGSYRERSHPSAFLAEWLPTLAPHLGARRALDVACGQGRNALHLAAAGLEVDAIDISAVGLALAAETAAARGLTVNWIAADLDEAPLAAGAYGLVLVSRFLARARVADLARALGPHGVLLYEQHVDSDAEVGGPRSAAFRLRPNELLRLFADLHVVHYAEGLVADPDGRDMALARLVATRHPLELRLPAGLRRGEHPSG